MIRKWLAGILLTMALILAAGLALAETAVDIAPQCKYKSSYSKYKYAQLTSGKFTNYWYTESAKHNYLTIIAPSGESIHGVYLCFMKMPDAYEVQVPRGSGWETIATGDTFYYHVYYEIPGGASSVRIYVPTDKKQALGFNQIYAFTEGELPDWVQRWEPPLENADILFMSTHPDDELIFFGGAIPTAVDQGRRVEVAYLTSSNTTRRSELLNGLWALGVRNYPLIGPFGDSYQKNLKQQYKMLGGEAKVDAWAAEVIRRVKPQVVVTQDINGEYGHPMHKVLAAAVTKVFDQTGDPAQYPESAETYGAWQAQKLYVHLWEENASRFDWETPLASFDGQTGIELADYVYRTIHVTQKTSGMSVDDEGVKYDNHLFGLYSSQVGPDVAGGDFFEHIDSSSAEASGSDGASQSGDAEDDGGASGIAANTASDDAGEMRLGGLRLAGGEADPQTSGTQEPEQDQPEEIVGGLTPAEDQPEEIVGGLAPAEDQPEEIVGGLAPAEDQPEEIVGGLTPAEDLAGNISVWWGEAPELDAILPSLNEKGYLDEGEFVWSSEEQGLYVYVDTGLCIVIRRTYEVPDARHPFYCFTAEIWCDLDQGVHSATLFSNPEKPRKDPKFISDIATEQKIVFATSTDYYTYRAGMKSEQSSYHVGIEVRNGEIFWDDPNKKPPTMPNYATLAFYPDGHLESWLSTEKGAQAYVDEGAYDVYCFGPCLIRDGEFTDYLKTANTSYNPRYAFGMVEPGHYIAVLCEGRVARSKGVQMVYLAQLLKDRGCQLAVNLDGGQTAVFTFMGVQLNQVVKTDPRGRKQVECLAFGSSDLVGSYAIGE